LFDLRSLQNTCKCNATKLFWKWCLVTPSSGTLICWATSQCYSHRMDLFYFFTHPTRLDTVYKPKYQWLLGIFTKLQKVTMCFVMSVCPTAPVNYFASNRWIFMKSDIYFLKICQEISSFIKIEHEQQVLYTKTSTHLRPNLTQFLLQ